MSSSSTVSRRGTNSASGTPARPRPPALARRLFLFSLTAYLLLGSGTIASSDGLTMFTLSESLLDGRLDIPPGGNGKPGRNGLFYAKADPGQAVIALPLVAAGQLSARLLPPGPWRDLWPAAIASTLNAFAGAAAVVVFLFLVRSLGYSPRTALVLSLGLGFSTSLLPYTKSFMREPLLLLFLLLSFFELRLCKLRPRENRRRALRAGLWLGAGMLVKATLGLNAPILLAYHAARPGGLRTAGGGRAVLAFLAGPAAAVVILGLYNAARFGHPLATGYDPAVDNFSTPLAVGLYGQLLSSGKSIFLYAPLGLAALWGFSGLKRHHRAEAMTAGAILAVNVIFHAKFASWAGEGSWGPRYLVPFLPFLILPAAELFQTDRPARQRVAALALAAGLLVQAGGTAIYFGSYMRELGEYPYERTFSDPQFMVRSHFVPNDSPVVGHWRLLLRNGALLWNDERRPHLTPRPEVAGRLPLDESDRDELRYVVDFWFCYLLYAGMRGWVVVVPLMLLGGLTGWAAWRLRASGRAGEDPLPGVCPDE